jgi:hypothetical protein
VRDRGLHDIAAVASALKTPELLNYTSTDSGPVSDMQRDLLRHHGINADSVRNSDHATVIFWILGDRSKRGLASVRQVLWMQRLGYPDAESATTSDAKRFLGRKWGGPRTKSFLNRTSM